MAKTPVWRMIFEAENALGGDVFSMADIRKYILDHFGAVNEDTIRAQVNAYTVNQMGRVGMPENLKPRIANGKYDFLYSVGRGLFTRFDPEKHGVWEIAEQDGKRIVRIASGHPAPLNLAEPENPRARLRKRQVKKRSDIESPSRDAVLHYIKAWDDLEGYRAQESALYKLFHEYCPENKQLDDVLLKTTALNAFYATNIYYEYAVAKHIVSLEIDSRLNQGDINLVTAIASGHGVKNSRTGKEIYFYSFATKYCSHHRPELFPIYDSYVEKLLVYLRDNDNFADFDNVDLRNSVMFKEIILKMREFYALNEFTLKEIDRYLWQYGKEKF